MSQTTTMEQSKKTDKNHYRKVFKSDHLGVADLEEFLEEGKKLVFTISHVKQEMGVTVAGKKGNFNIAYFVDKIKPLVLNSTNSKVLKGFAGGSPFVEDWNNILIELHIDSSVQMKGSVVGGVRIRPVQPNTSRPELNPSSPNWNKAKESVKNNKTTFEAISKHYSITAENYALLCG